MKARTRPKRPPRQRWRRPLLAAILPAVLCCVLLLAIYEREPRVWVSILLIALVPAIVVWLTFAEAWNRPFQVLSNLVAALREGDFSLRFRPPSAADDPFTQTMLELNRLADVQRDQRFASEEAQRLLIKVLGELEYGVFTINPQGHLVIVNPAMAKLFGRTPAAMEGRHVKAAGLAPLLEGPAGTVFSWEFPERSGRWLLSKGQTWAGGEAHQFVILRDVSDTLRTGEIDAWKRLIRVMGHELNNSLTPLLSLTSHLSMLFDSDKLPENWQEEARESLAIIHRRASHLSKFIDRYSSLARLPSPTLESIDLPTLLRRVASMPQRVPVLLGAGEPCRILADATQIEQVFINLIKNGAESVEAAAVEGGQVMLGWRRAGEFVEVEVVDDGTGLSNGESIFVPFYSTKPAGSGIGLTLSFQIVHAHHGRLELTNRTEARGCTARVCLPVA